MSTAIINQGVTFGPFRMPHLREQVDERFRRAFYSYLAEKVLPLLDGKIDRIEGRVGSDYDQLEFVDLVEVRFRYCYKISCFCEAGVEEAAGELDYDPSTASWTPSRIKPPGVRTLTDKRRAQALFESHRHRPPRPEDCPNCHSHKVAEIIYGVPHWSETFQAELDSGRICLGGAWAWEESRQWRCLSCEHEWGITGFVLALRELEEREKSRDE